ncbi:unnamed protein product [Ectocarpus sp. 8 AP-2014]
MSFYFRGRTLLLSPYSVMLGFLFWCGYILSLAASSVHGRANTWSAPISWSDVRYFGRTQYDTAVCRRKTRCASSRGEEEVRVGYTAISSEVAKLCRHPSTRNRRSTTVIHLFSPDLDFIPGCLL